MFLSTLKRTAMILALVALFPHCLAAATVVDTTIARKPVAPHVSTGARILNAPAWIIRGPLLLVEEVTKAGVKIATDEPASLEFLRKIFGTEQALYPLLSFGTRSGVEFGLGLYLHDRWATQDRIRAEAVYSTNKYEKYRISYAAPKMLGEHTGLAAVAEYRWKPRESFYGLGNCSVADDEVSVTLESARAALRLTWEPAEKFRSEFDFGYAGYDAYDGDDDDYPRYLEEIYGLLDMVPGDFASYHSIEIGASGRLDYRNNPWRPSGGGTAALRFKLHRGVGSSDGLNILVSETDLWQYFPLFRERTLALRLNVRNSIDLRNDDGRRTPFYLFPSLGGEHDHRGYESDRFFGRSSALATVEYRFPVLRYADGFIFVDEGRVFESLDEDFTWRNWHVSYGIGVRGLGDMFSATFARSDERVQIYMTMEGGF